MAEIALEKSWLSVLEKEFTKPYMIGLKSFLQEEKRAGQLIYPPADSIFRAMNITPFDRVKVIILGQDPYHGAGQAHGLSFSVPTGVPIPPSLKNIYKELIEDVNIRQPMSGDLTSWAKQGVLLLNSTLTVRAGQAGSHQKKGWEQFTNTIISKLSTDRQGLVFLLWGAYARAKKELIDQSVHFILESAHPSPFSAHTGFLGSKQFSKTNELLLSVNKTPIDWEVQT